MKKVVKYLPGMAIALVLAAAAKGLEALEKAAGLHFIGASVIALFLGMIINHFRKPTAAPSAAASFFFTWTPIAANTNTDGMMASVRVSFTIVAKSPAASLKA